MKKLGIEHYDAIAISKGGRAFAIDGVPVLNKNRILCVCNKNHEWQPKCDQISQGYWCPHCAGNIPHDLNFIQNLAKANSGTCLSTTYKGMSQKYNWKCEKNHIWSAKANDIQQGQWCNICRHLKHDLKWLKEKAEKVGSTLLSSDYEGPKKRYELKCKKKEHLYKTIGALIAIGHGCPMCARNQRNFHSIAELEIFSLIKEKYSDALNGQTGLLPSRRFELDIYIPSLRKAIEYDGPRHDPNHRLHKPKNLERDTRKNYECKKLGIHLLRVNYKNWELNKNLEINKIWAFLES